MSKIFLDLITFASRKYTLHYRVLSRGNLCNISARVVLEAEPELTGVLKSEVQQLSGDNVLLGERTTNT